MAVVAEDDVLILSEEGAEEAPFEGEESRGGEVVEVGAGGEELPSASSSKDSTRRFPPVLSFGGQPRSLTDQEFRDESTAYTRRQVRWVEPDFLLFR
jgi:hypothetical protein